MKCEVKWVFRSITKSKASGGDGIAVELYQILKDDAVKVLHSIYQQMWKTQQWPQDWKGRFPCNPQERWFQRMFNYHTVALISHATKVISSSKSTTLHELWNSRCSTCILKSQRNQRSNYQHPLDHQKSKQEISSKISPYALLQMAKILQWQSLWQCGSQQSVKNFFNRWEYQATSSASWEICVQVKKQQLELDIEP